MLVLAVAALSAGVVADVSPKWEQHAVDHTYHAALRHLTRAAAVASVRPSAEAGREADLAASLRARLRSLGVELLEFRPMGDEPRFILSVDVVGRKADDIVGVTMQLRLAEPVLLRRGVTERLAWATTWETGMYGTSSRGAPLDEWIADAVASSLDTLTEQYRTSQE